MSTFFWNGRIVNVDRYLPLGGKYCVQNTLKMVPRQCTGAARLPLYHTTRRHIADGHNPFCLLYAICWFLADVILRRKGLDRVTCKAIATADWQAKPKQLGLFRPYTGVLTSPQPDQEGNKLQRQKILIFIYPIYNHNWRNINTTYIYNKTSIKRNILTIEQNTSGSRSG